MVLVTLGIVGALVTLVAAVAGLLIATEKEAERAGRQSVSNSRTV